MPPTVFEFGYLCSDKDEGDVQGYTVIPDADFRYLEESCLTEDNSGFNQLMMPRIKRGSRLLQVQNFVGVIFVPSGNHIEVLPKTGLESEFGETTYEEARSTLLTMLQALGEFRHIQLDNAGLKSLKMPLLEVFISRFLDNVNSIVKRGLKRDYVGQEDNLLVKKGKLNMSGQLRHNSVTKHRFYCEFDEYVENRPVNRLLKTAMLTVQGYCRNHSNLKLLRELLFAFDVVPNSLHTKQDFDSVRLDRGMQYYKPALAWAKLILGASSPISMKGEAGAPSLLFPMEAVFEAFVAKTLQSQLHDGYSLRTQARAEKLVTHHVETGNSRDLFTLKPDLMIEKAGSPTCVLDTKWKRINPESTNKFDLSQADFYQMFAYGEKYLEGKGKLVLIYPKTDKFASPIEGHFAFSKDLTLWVLPFDIKKNGASQLILPDASSLSKEIICSAA
ncbi:McrC family protein [Photobacterium leiognathi]|uniref:Restriction endonuclease n=1 Tax=Photobacterium leiognathi subsp. mandapamensis TaxID=48408 RepID=A0A2T3L0V4_PHOLD|nr:McrC family protein [Photobacterium leiognathi]PSV14003.1 restriction endonuclease [Photobacterium leiognathi subsp. mandapamensis]